MQIAIFNFVVQGTVLVLFTNQKYKMY